MATKEPVVEFSVRLPELMHKRLLRLANANERTLNGQIRLAIREHLEKEGDTA